MTILGNFETTMIQKQSMVILVNYKDNYDTTTTTTNKSMGFDLSAIQSCSTPKLLSLEKLLFLKLHLQKTLELLM